MNLKKMYGSDKSIKNINRVAAGLKSSGSAYIEHNGEKLATKRYTDLLDTKTKLMQLELKKISLKYDNLLNKLKSSDSKDRS